MDVKALIVAQPARLWKFMGFFQSPFLRIVHALVVLLVILQLLSSDFTDAPFFSAFHTAEGIVLCVLAVIMTVYSFSKRGFRYFFPYLWKDTEQLSKDLSSMLRFKLVAPRPKGLATCVQGLGFGALLLTAFAGLWWRELFHVSSHWAGFALSVHIFAAQLLIVYAVGHGFMALLHFVIWQRRIFK